MNVDKIKDHVPHTIICDNCKYSVVNIPLIKNGNDYDIVFEERSKKLKTQPGDICFPGGRIDSNESLHDALYRETMEELLIDNTQIELIGQSDSFYDKGRKIFSFVTILTGYNNTFNESEVERIIRIPLSKLANQTPEVYYIEHISSPLDDFPFERINNGKNYSWRKANVPVYFYEYEDIHIWGITAELLRSFLKNISI